MSALDLRLVRTGLPLDATLPMRAGEPLDVVFVEGFVGETVISLCADEMHATQPVRIDVALAVPRLGACTTDRIDDTVDYSRVRDALRELLDAHRHQLLEAFAETVAQRMLAAFAAHWVRVAVAKPRKFQDVDAVGVVIERRRAPASEPRTSGGERSVLSLIGAGMVPHSAP